MPEPEVKTPETENQNPNPEPENKTPETPETENKTYTADEVKKIASEKKAAVDMAKTLQVELDKLKAEKNKAAEDDAKKKGDYQSIIDAKQSEIDELKTKAEKADLLQQQIEEIETETRKELLSRLDKDGKEFAKDLSISKLREYVKIAGKTLAPPSDNGKGATSGDVKLTDAQKREAEIMGLDDKAYFEVMEKRKQNLENKK